MLGDRVLLIEHGQITVDMPVTLPRPRQRKSQEFIALAEEILEQVMGHQADSTNVQPAEMTEIIYAYWLLPQVKLELPLLARYRAVFPNAVTH